MNRETVAGWFGVAGIFLSFGGIATFYVLRPGFVDGFAWASSSVSWVPGAITGFGVFCVLMALAVFYSD